MSKPKILCMHGYGTNAKFMQKQSAHFMKHIIKQIQPIFIDGPFPAPQNFVVDQKVIDMIEGDLKSWTTSIADTDNRQQFIKELQKLRIAFQSASDHYDGIMGFSQGAVLMHLLLKYQAQGIIDWKILKGIKFVIFLSGSYRKGAFFNNWQKQLQIPSLHILSSLDFIYQKSLIAITQFKDPELIFHSYGHKFPKLDQNDTKKLIQFIRANTAKKQNQNGKILMASMSNL